jgi:hypothetical protein
MVYGDAQVSERHKMWDMLKYIDLLMIFCGSVLVISMRFCTDQGTRVLTNEVTDGSFS